MGWESDWRLHTCDVVAMGELCEADGECGTSDILDNCHIRVAFSTNDERTAKRISDALGTATELPRVYSNVSSASAAVVPLAASAWHRSRRMWKVPSSVGRCVSRSASSMGSATMARIACGAPTVALAATGAASSQPRASCDAGSRRRRPSTKARSLRPSWRPRPHHRWPRPRNTRQGK